MSAIKSQYHQQPMKHLFFIVDIQVTGMLIFNIVIESDTHSDIIIRKSIDIWTTYDGVIFFISTSISILESSKKRMLTGITLPPNSTS